MHVFIVTIVKLACIIVFCVFDCPKVLVGVSRRLHGNLLLFERSASVNVQVDVTGVDLTLGLNDLWQADLVFLDGFPLLRPEMVDLLRVWQARLGRAVL